MQPTRYARQELFPGIGRAGQQKLADASVTVVGCGALGTVVATALARAGVGRLRIIDRDFVELHNLQRQILFEEQDVADQLPKAVAAERHLRRVNSAIEIEGVVADVNSSNAVRLLEGCDVLVDGLDNIDTRYLINDVAHARSIPWIYGAAVSSYGMTLSIVPGVTPCIRCVFPEAGGAGRVETCDTAGVLAAAPMVIGALEAAQALRILVGERPTRGILTNIDVWTGHFQRLDVGSGPSPDCPACRGEYDYLEGRAGAGTTVLCGQNAVQIAATGGKVSLEELAERLRPVGKVAVNSFMLRLAVEGCEIVVFPDGRAIVQGTNDEAVARGLCAKYVGG